MFRIWASLDINTPLSEIPDQARRAEAMGFHGILAPDVMTDGFLAAHAAITATERIRVGTSALVCFPRSPMTTGVAAWNLQALSGGRFHLGLGPLIRANIIGKYSTPWTPPAPRMREYVQSLHALFECWQNRTPIDFHGEHYQFTKMQDFVKPQPIEHPHIPIHLAAIGPNMTALVGEVGDAQVTHPTNTTPRYLRELARPRIEVGAKRTGRDPSKISIIANPMVATGPDEKKVASELQRQHELMAILLSTPSYWPTLDLYGWRPVGEKLHGMVREDRWSEMTNAVSEEMVVELIPRATYGGLAAVLRDLYDGLADALTLTIPEDPTDDEAVAGIVSDLQGA
jgi:probable F420-dependent oxidoreductase